MNLTVKCHFAKTGRHLHIAVFQGRKVEARMEEGLTHITLMVHTYQLCSRKPTRSPPNYMHTCQADIGPFDLPQTPQILPCTLTWTDSHLYVSWSSATLSVYRVALFSQPNDRPLGMGPEVKRPRETILLPSSAQYRDVFFFPAHEDSTTFKNIIGAPVYGQQRDETPTPNLTAMRPIGCVLHAEHLGEWVTSEPISGRWRRNGEGRLNTPDERFGQAVACVREYIVGSAARDQ